MLILMRGLSDNKDASINLRIVLKYGEFINAYYGPLMGGSYHSKISRDDTSHNINHVQPSHKIIV